MSLFIKFQILRILIHDESFSFISVPSKIFPISIDSFTFKMDVDLRVMFKKEIVKPIS